MLRSGSPLSEHGDELEHAVRVEVHERFAENQELRINDQRKTLFHALTKPAGLRSRYGQSPTEFKHRADWEARAVGRTITQCEPNTFMNHRITKARRTASIRESPVRSISMTMNCGRLRGYRGGCAQGRRKPSGLRFRLLSGAAIRRPIAGVHRT